QTLGQVLMTVGFALIFQDLALLIWGGDPYSIRPPSMLAGVVTAGPGRFPVYRIFIVVVAVVVGAALWLALDRTRVGAMIRAAVAAAAVAPTLPSYPLTLLTQVAIMAILAMSLDILLGYTGLPSLGHAAYFGTAAYAVGILATERQAGFLTCLVAGVLLATAA